MFTKYYGDEHLEDNNTFWFDVFALFKEKNVRMPLSDNPKTRARLEKMLDCPGGACSSCCEYNRVPLNSDDLKRMEIAGVKPKITTDKDKLYLDTTGGCQFLQDGKCSIYGIRPKVCAEYPFQNPTQAVYQGQTFNQVNYRLRCFPALMVIREILTEACRGGMMLLPDLSLVMRKETGNANPDTKE
jgi:Fe-S-cluster containining protein